MALDTNFSVPTAQLDEARRGVAGASCWILSDGKAGDEAQCLGVAERLGLVAEIRRIRPRAFFALAMPYGPIDPREREGQVGSPLSPPFPTIAIASGRRTVPYLRRLKQLAGRQTLTVFLKDPRTGRSAADLIWVPAHDRLRGDNVLVTLTSPHRIAPERLMAAQDAPAPWGAPDGRRLVAVLLGGDSRHHRFTAADSDRLTEHLGALAMGGDRLLVTPSRRTPAALAHAVQAITAASGGFYWQGEGENPYLAMLAQAAHIIVTADSVNMLGEAAATGTPIHLFSPTGGHTKMSAFVNGLVAHGAVRPLAQPLESWSYTPLDATPEIAVAVAAAYRRLGGQ